MTPFVIDATVFILFAKIDRFDTLRRILDHATVYTGEKVFKEVLDEKELRAGARELLGARGVWITVLAPQDVSPIMATQRNLRAADQEALLLARQLNAHMCSDDLAVRMTAQEIGIPVIGTLGLIQLGMDQGLFPPQEALTMGEAIVRVGLRISPTLLEAWKQRISG